jgi:hypothetical protein
VDFNNLLKDGRFLDRTPEAINAEGKFRFATYMRGGAVWFYYLAVRALQTTPKPQAASRAAQTAA